jgi:hypothetical protein
MSTTYRRRSQSVENNDKQRFRTPDNFRYVLSSRTHGTNILSGSINVEKLQRLGKPKV